MVDVVLLAIHFEYLEDLILVNKEPLPEVLGDTRFNFIINQDFLEVSIGVLTVALGLEFDTLVSVVLELSYR